MNMSYRLFLAIGWVTVLASAALGQERTEPQTERDLRRLEPQPSRMANRTDYWSKDVWPQVKPWLEQYNIRTVRPTKETAGREEKANQRVAEREVQAAQRAAFGFKDPKASFTDDVWFYDYYTYWPSYFSSANESATDYTSAVRYFDFDNDGVYETTAAYRDSDHDGRFDEFDRYDFTLVESDKEPDYSPIDATRYTVSGKVRSKRTTTVNDVEHVIVRVAQDDVASVIVDLGPTDRWTEIDVEAGSMIKATGPMERIGEKNVLIAESVSLGEKPVRVEPTSPKYSGTVLEVKKFQINDAEHTLAIIATSDGNQLVDFGPSDALKVNVVAQEKIEVYGIPVRINDRQVVMASRLDLGGKSFSISRWK